MRQKENERMQIPFDIPNEIKAIFFDVFDTLIVRSFESATDLFWLVEEQLVKENGIIFKGFAEDRVFAEQYARKNKQAKYGISEISIEEIYFELSKKYPISAELEQRIEYDNCFPYVEILYFFRLCKEHNLKIFLVSDMYLSSDFISSILRKCGYDGWDKIFISHEKKCSKHDGGLYQLLLDEVKVEYGIMPHEILHFGDNEFADYKQARRFGLQSRLIPKLSEKNLSIWKRNDLNYQFNSREEKLWKSISEGLTNIFRSENDP